MDWTMYRPYLTTGRKTILAESFDQLACHLFTISRNALYTPLVCMDSTQLFRHSWDSISCTYGCPIKPPRSNQTHGKNLWLSCSTDIQPLVYNRLSCVYLSQVPSEVLLDLLDHLPCGYTSRWGCAKRNLLGSRSQPEIFVACCGQSLR